MCTTAHGHRIHALHMMVLQSFADYLLIEIGNRKDLVCSCGLLNRICSASIIFGVNET